MAKSKSKTVKSAALTPDQTGTLEALKSAWEEERMAEAAHVGDKSAATVRRILEAQSKSISRESIAVFLGTTSGALSRHMAVARESATPVKIGTEEYPSALAALDSGKESLRTVYHALNPTRTSNNKGKIAKDKVAAVESLVRDRNKKPRTVQYRDGKTTKTLNVVMSREDWLTAIAVLLAQPIGGLSKNTIEQIIDAIPAEPEENPAAPSAPPVDKAA